MKKVVVNVPHVVVEDKNGDVVLTVGAAEAVISQKTALELIYALAGLISDPKAAAEYYSPAPLNQLRDAALKIAAEHGFTDATVGEDVALFHSEASELLEDHRAGKKPTEIWYEAKTPQKDGATIRYTFEDYAAGLKPCGIPSECADLIIRVLHFCGKHGIDIEKAVREKMAYNASRPHRHGGKKL